MPRPMPLLAPVTMTLRPFKDVNMLQPSLLETCIQELTANHIIGQRDGTLRVARAELASVRNFRMRRQPRGQQNAPQNDEGRDFRFRFGAQGSRLAIARAPRLQQIRNDGFMLDEADGGGEIVNEPAEAAIVEVDDAQMRSVHQQIGKPQIGMHQAEHVRAVTEPFEPLPDDWQHSFENRDSRWSKTDGLAPGSPKSVRAYH